MGSRLHELRREKDLLRVGTLARQYAEQALTPLLDARRAKSITTTQRLVGAAGGCRRLQRGAHNLSPVDGITGGFLCQDMSLAGRKPTGLRSERRGRFWEVVRILKKSQPRWVVLENVVNLLAANDSQDFEAVIRALEDGGYVGFWECLMLSISESPSSVAASSWSPVIEECPTLEPLADAAPVDAIPPASGSIQWPQTANAWAANTLLANNSGSQIVMGCTAFVAEPTGSDG